MSGGEGEGRLGEGEGEGRMEGAAGGPREGGLLLPNPFRSRRRACA